MSLIRPPHYSDHTIGEKSDVSKYTTFVLVFSFISCFTCVSVPLLVSPSVQATVDSVTTVEEDTVTSYTAIGIP